MTTPSVKSAAKLKTLRTSLLGSLPSRKAVPVPGWVVVGSNFPFFGSWRRGYPLSLVQRVHPSGRHSDILFCFLSDMSAPQVFVGGTPQDNSRKSYGSGETGIPTPTSTGLSSGFLQQDVVHVLNLVCPDFPVEIVGRVRRAKSVSLEARGLKAYWVDETAFKCRSTTFTCSICSTKRPASVHYVLTHLHPSCAIKGRTFDVEQQVVKILAEGRHDADLAQPLDDCRERFLQKQHQTCQGTTAVERMPFEMFLQAFSIYFCFQVTAKHFLTLLRADLASQLKSR